MVKIVKLQDKMTRIELGCEIEILHPKDCVELATKLLERYVEVMKHENS